MKKEFLFLVLAFLLLLFISAHCKKDHLPPAVLPPATQEGKNTIGFTINGEVWVPYYKCGFSRNPCGEISARYSYPFAAFNAIDFGFTRSIGSESSWLAISSAMTGTITSIGEKIDSISVEFEGKNWTGNESIYQYPRPGSSFIITKFDSTNQIISGKFKFVLIERKDNGTIGNNIITLEDGRFDFKFNACKCSN